jgi:hypothetical protein
MRYRFQPLEELCWGVVIAAGLVLLQGLVTLDPATVTDWQTWIVALGGAAIRAAAGAAIDYLRRSMVESAERPEAPAVPVTVDAVADELERRRRERVEQRLREASDG